MIIINNNELIKKADNNGISKLLYGLYKNI